MGSSSAKATGSPPARRHNRDWLRGKAKKPKHKTKESPSPSFKSTQKHNHKPGLQSPFLSTRLVQYLAAIWHILSPPLTQPHSIQNNMLIMLAESRFLRRKLVRHPVDAGLFIKPPPPRSR